MPDIASTTTRRWARTGSTAARTACPEWETFHIDELLRGRSEPPHGPRAQGAPIAGSRRAASARRATPHGTPTVQHRARLLGRADIAFSPDVGAGAPHHQTRPRSPRRRAAKLDVPGPRDERDQLGHARPATLANNLRGMNIRMYWGTGEPGRSTAETPKPARSRSRRSSTATTSNFANVSNRSRSRVLQPYGPGTHSWPYWTPIEGKHRPITEALEHPPATRN